MENVNKSSENEHTSLYCSVIMSTILSQITGVSTVYSIACSGADKRKHQSSASLAFVRGIEFPSQRASNAEIISSWWRHHIFHATLLPRSHMAGLLAGNEGRLRICLLIPTEQSTWRKHGVQICWCKIALDIVRLPPLSWRHYGNDGVSNHRRRDCSGADLRKHQSCASLAFLRGIRWIPLAKGQ